MLNLFIFYSALSLFNFVINISYFTKYVGFISVKSFFWNLFFIFYLVVFFYHYTCIKRLVSYSNNIIFNKSKI